nr:GyrI-like domain-containing protein [Ktedonobacteraceae bacterium]
GMFSIVDNLRKELSVWLKQHDLEPAGPPFLRYHIIDMAGMMHIEVGIPVVTALPGDERVSPGVLPAGRYASLVYVGHGLTGNKALLGWGQANDIVWDRWDDERGDAFRARCETYLTDPKVQPLKTKWEIEVAIKLADS